MSTLLSFIAYILLLFLLFSKSFEISDKNLINSLNNENEQLPKILNDEEDKNILKKRQNNNNSNNNSSDCEKNITNIFSSSSSSNMEFMALQQQLQSSNAHLQQQLQSIQSQLQQQLLSSQAQLQQQLQSIQAQLTFLTMGFRLPPSHMNPFWPMTTTMAGGG